MSGLLPSSLVPRDEFSQKEMLSTNSVFGRSLGWGWGDRRKAASKGRCFIKQVTLLGDQPCQRPLDRGRSPATEGKEAGALILHLPSSLADGTWTCLPCVGAKREPSDGGFRHM